MTKKKIAITLKSVVIWVGLVVVKPAGVAHGKVEIQHIFVKKSQN